MLMIKPASIYGMGSIDFYSILTVVEIQVERTAQPRGHALVGDTLWLGTQILGDLKHWQPCDHLV